MKLTALLESIHESVELSTAEELQRACKLIAHAQSMVGGERDTIVAAYESGPLEDGNVPSKSARDQLIEKGFIVKVVMRGQDGWNALTHEGRDIHHILAAMENQQ